LLAFTARKETAADKITGRNGLRTVTGAGVCIRQMDDADLERILELRNEVRWSADPRAFDLLRGVRDARWAVAEAPSGDLAGMVGAVPLGDIGILCHLAVRDGYRGLGLGARLSSWAVTYLRSRGARTVRLYSTLQAEGLYRSLGFEEVTPRTVYRLEDGPRKLRMGGRVDGHRVEALAFGDLPELYGVDHWSFGGDRSALLFATLRLHPGRGLLARDATGRIKGYLIRTTRDRATRIGPFLASTPIVARLLLTHALPAAGGAPVQVTVPGPARCQAHALLQELGFEGKQDRLRMELGEEMATPTGLAHYGTTPYLAT
jgi:ribosomal protein S18 acetylase RimI-like enzyme